MPISGWKRTLKSDRERPKVITFDAYNTLYATSLPVMEQYCLVAKKHEIVADPAQLTKNFPRVFKKLKERHPNYGKFTNITAVEWWSQLITDVFKPLEVTKDVIDEILSRFEGEQAYEVYPDVLHFIEEAKTKHPDVILGIVSNTDPLVYTLLKNLGLLDYFNGNIFLSYNLDVKKPSKEIFDYVLKDLTERYPMLARNLGIEQLRSQCWHIGDEAMNDMYGAEGAGWNGVLIDRSNKYGHLSNSFEEIERSADILSVDKIDTNSSLSYKVSLKQTDAVLLSERTAVVSNFKTLEAMLL